MLYILVIYTFDPSDDVPNIYTAIVGICLEIAIQIFYAINYQGAMEHVEWWIENYWTQLFLFE